ncbi:MAG: TetR/AcrR family transcriptional regulator [Bacilli bacterium]|nr:TetR/AcrR family transcriptional regulator [Bacilli bacterium]
MPKTKEQFEQIRNERINVILDTALHLFVMEGYDAVNLDKVTKEAKCSHGLIYHYFSGKDDLYISVINNLVIPYIKEILAGISFEQKAKFVIHDLLDVILKKIKAVDDKNAWKIYLFLNTHLQKNLFVKNSKEKTPIFQKTLELIERGQREGDFNDGSSTELTICVLSLIKGLAFTRIHIGYKRFICPNSSIIMKMLYK